jgi:hypothetical protein
MQDLLLEVDRVDVRRPERRLFGGPPKGLFAGLLLARDVFRGFQALKMGGFDGKMDVFR